MKSIAQFHVRQRFEMREAVRLRSLASCQAKCLKPLKAKVVYIILKNSVHTAKKVSYVSITKMSSLMLFKEVSRVHTDSHLQSAALLTKQMVLIVTAWLCTGQHRVTSLLTLGEARLQQTTPSRLELSGNLIFSC
jgi:hypothetical protein